MDRAIPLRSVDVFATVETTTQHQSQKSKIIDKFNDSAKKLATISLAAKKIKDAADDVVANVKQLQEASDPALEVFETKDPDLLRQYYELRHDAYRNENGWVEYDGTECEYDKQGRIIVAVKNGKVVGGVRAMISNECDHLSNEIPGTEYVYDPIIAKYDGREKLNFFEISAVVVAKGERNGKVSSELFWHALRKAKVLSCDYLCGVAMVVTCRDYRRIFNSFGYQIEIVMNRLWCKKSTYNFAKMFPMYMKLVN
jgi:hypothetical protein